MATNKYFNQYNHTNSQSLVEDIVIETIKYAGIDCYYIPRTISDSFDEVLGEDELSEFNQKFPIEMFVETIDGFEGDGDFISKFGLEIRDTITLNVSKKRFLEECTKNDILDSDDNLYVRPLEGDLVYFPFNKGLFEIKFVEHEQPFYQLGKNYIFTLKTELFTSSHENIIDPLGEDNPVDGNEDYIVFDDNETSYANNTGDTTNSDNWFENINDDINNEFTNPTGDINY